MQTAQQCLADDQKIRIQDAGSTEVAPETTTCLATVVEPRTDQS